MPPRRRKDPNPALAAPTPPHAHAVSLFVRPSAARPPVPPRDATARGHAPPSAASPVSGAHRPAGGPPAAAGGILGGTRLGTGAPAAGASSVPTPGGGPAQVAVWRARLEALTYWCLSPLALTPAVAESLTGVRPTLGELLRKALGKDASGVVDLLDALAAPDTPAARALLGRVLGTDLLLVVVTLRAGAIARADARSCRAPTEARALLDAYLGASAPGWTLEHGLAQLPGGRVPLLARGMEELLGVTPPARQHGDATLVLPLLTLDAPPAAEAAATEAAHAEAAPARDAAAEVIAEAAPAPLPAELPPLAPAILGGTLRPGAAFLDAAPAVVDDEEAPARERAADADADEDEDDADPSDAHGEDAYDEDEDDEGDGADDADTADAGEVLAPAYVAAEHTRAPRDLTPPEPVIPPDLDVQGALDRLRARSAAVPVRVPALVATDDGMAEHVTDVSAWLAEASDQELLALARARWCGDAAVDAAYALAEDDPEVEEVVHSARRHESGLVVEIDPTAAAAWVERFRPALADQLGRR